MIVQRIFQIIVVIFKCFVVVVLIVVTKIIIFTQNCRHYHYYYLINPWNNHCINMDFPISELSWLHNIYKTWQNINQLHLLIFKHSDILYLVSIHKTNSSLRILIHMLLCFPFSSKKFQFIIDR